MAQRELPDGSRTPLLEDPESVPQQLAPRPDAPVDWAATGLCFLFPAIGGLLFGFDIGATSGALVSLKDATLSGTDWYGLSTFQSGLVVSMSLLGALAGSLITLAAGNKLGRKTELLLAALLYGSSALVTSAASGLDVLLLGRLVYGLGIGFAMHAAPAYIAEVAPSNVRGLLISLKEGFIVGGILLGYLVSYLFVADVGGWREIYGTSGGLALVLGLGMATLPESPRWLLLSGKGMAAAREALHRSQGQRAAVPELVEEEMQEILSTVTSLRASPDSQSNVWSLLGQRRYTRPLLVGTSLMLLQQVTGQPSVLYYAANIFQSAGFKGAATATGVSVILGSFKLVMTMVAVIFVDVWGRRPLLLWGVSGLTAALAVLTLATPGNVDTLAASSGEPGLGAAWASVGALLLYVGCYQVSFGPISWLVVGEVFPLAVRGQAIAIATFVNFSSNFLVSLALPSLESSMGLKYTYALFGAVGLLAVTTIYYIVPETKGKSLEEIEKLFTDPADKPRSGSRDA